MSRFARALWMIFLLLLMAVRLPFPDLALSAPADPPVRSAAFDAPSALQPKQQERYPDVAIQQGPLNVELSHFGGTPGATPFRPGDTVHVTFRIWNHEGLDLTRVILNLYYSGDRLTLVESDPEPGEQASGWAYWPDLTVDFGGIGPYDIVEVAVSFKVQGSCPPGAQVSVEMVAEAKRGAEALSTTQAEAFTIGCEPNPEPGDLQVTILAPAQVPLGVRRYYVIQATNTGTASLYNVHAVVYTDKLYVHEMYPSGGEWADPEFQWAWHEIEAGASRRAALLFEIPPGAAAGTVYHTSVEYGADYLPRAFVYKDIAAIAPQPTRTPTPTPQPAISADLVCQSLDPADGQVAVGEWVTLYMLVTNTGPTAIQNLAATLEWDAACLEYGGSGSPPPEPVTGPDGGSWVWERWGPPYVLPGATVNLQISLRAIKACGKTTLAASLSNPALPATPPLDHCTAGVTIVVSDTAACGADSRWRGAPVEVATADELCTQLVANRTFEMTATLSGAPLFWETAGLLAPRVTTETVHSGSQSLLIGLPGAEEVAGDGWAWQWVTLPADVQSATLRFWYRVLSADGDVEYDRFEAGVLNRQRMAMAGGFVSGGTEGWAEGTVNLTAYAGRTVAVAFHVRQDGNAGSTWAFVDDVSLCVSPVAVPVPGPKGANGEGLCWADGGFVDYALVGMPDFDQVREGGKSNPAGAWTHDAAAAAADVLWWLDSAQDAGELPPPTVADGFGLVTAYDAEHDDHAAANVPALIADLATRFGTDAGGTAPQVVTTALQGYITSKGLQSQFTVTLHQNPTHDLLSSAAAEGDGVMLLLGFWEWQAMGFARLGGHYVALAGYSCNGVEPQLALSDPWRDVAETGENGRVSPWRRHLHSGSPRHTPHDNATVVSQDIYAVGEVGGVASLVGYSRAMGDLENFLGLNFAPQQGEPASYRSGLVFTRLDYAVVIAPAGGTTASTALAADAVLHGTVQRQGWPLTSAPDFPSLVTLWRPYDFSPTYAWVLNTPAGVEWTTPSFDAGMYTARAKGEGTLATMRLFEELSAGTTDLDFGTLLAGDVRGDDRVDALDISALAAAISSGSTSSRFDLNADGVLNGADMTLARDNFGNSGDVVVGMGIPPSEEAEGEANAAGAEAMAVLGLVPSASTAHLGHDWTLTVTAYAQNGPLDAVEVHLQFDPALLRVVDAAGDPVSYVTAGNALPLVIQNQVDNATGRIDYAATTLASGGYQGTFTVAQIRFRPLAVSEETWVRFLSEDWPVTMVAWHGTPALRRFDGASVEIGDEPLGWVYLPMVAGQ